ncbi:MULTISPECIES: GNAT family N-acetyltransferase [unclassified Rhizobium]|uniref:GNAT family N-acetyltransferase n=1 Tax=unclassified Rhizobium TaxID=2613769 RepID=UPI000DDDABA2|nr:MULTISPECIES: GNAT family N-acetyltransferase [unclassified Rhizobium]MBB3286380.1 GNAT superfamily N-acetyltransferase [Rhizobium sp. BK252]MBB3401426.1 GNAT superfamily N-acetyltransferase [Rhizobium sp. BK289]MBB3414004.1 GNAT superfamily N-acetyltransferase [Rhizobium sp. BK284]MBB3481891.1 GNAT superfamily N-acetyltransferase [Rhizobium sp. BK347]MDK4719517.1 GNAT family N-acetyltransferase [Rhizobium sp. CNPSo 3968]
MTEAISLRAATDADVDKIRALTREAYGKWVPLIGREPLPMMADYAEAVRKHRIDLVDAGGELVALIEMVPASDHLLIENVAVSPRHQGKGIGGRLLVHAEQVAATLGVDDIRLYTNKRFTENVQLYLRHGYAIDREEPLKDGFLVHMSKRIG